MASELAKKYAEDLQRRFDGARNVPWTRAKQVDWIASTIDRAIRASHAQRTRRENKELAAYLTEVAARPGSVYEIKAALRRARRGSK